MKCLHCNGAHDIDTCETFRQLTHTEKINSLKGKGRCFSCLKPGHMRSECRNRSTCDICNGKHPTSLHISTPPQSVNKTEQSSQTVDTATCVNAASNNDIITDLESTMAIVPVKVRSADGLFTVDTYAFMDSGSSGLFCSEELLYKLGIQGKQTRI